MAGKMTRTELLQHLIKQARENGFEFRKWFRLHTARPWTSALEAVDWLAQGDRAHMLLFSHSFARAFFCEGGRLRFIQPALAYQRLGPNGTVHSVQRRAHTRQSNREDVWLYHLREMAAADNALRYIRRYLLLEETMLEAQAASTLEMQTLPPASIRSGMPLPHSEPVDALEYDNELLVRD